MPRPRTVAILITAQCLFVSQIYLYLGGSSRGRTQFRQMMNFVLPAENEDLKAAALVLVVFAIPLLVAGAACALLLTDEPCGGHVDANKNRHFTQIDDDFSLETVDETVDFETTNHGTNNPTSRKCNLHPRTKLKAILRKIMHSPSLFAAVFVLIPCLFFYISNILRHYHSAVGDYPTFPAVNESDTDQQSSLMSNYSDFHQQLSNWRRALLQHIANDSAILALVAMAYLLVPISKHSLLVILSRWSPVQAVVVHKWAGRLAIFGVVMHGTLHLIIAYWKWWNAFARNDTLSHQETYSWLKRSFWYGYLPRWYCWKNAIFGGSIDESGDDSVDGSLEYQCYRDKCTCYDFFLNLTGLLGMVALIILGVSSVGYVRRHYYRLFYLVHIIAGPCFIVMATLHYKRTILYLCPSILYYASTTIPTYIQNWMKHCCSHRGTRIVTVTRISCPSLQNPNAAVWDIVFEASDKAFQQYRPGQNIYLHVPHVSLVKHPFTANRVPGSQNHLRLLIRETGPFTFQLGNCLNNSLERRNSIQLVTEQDEEAQSLPHASILSTYISGFHGISCRRQQLCSHDNVIIIAGGIGITPYLSLLFEIVDQQASLASTNFLKSLELHWICRDISLIRYIEEQYFSKMLTCSHPSDDKPSFSLEIVVHYTGNETSPSVSNAIAFSPETSSQYYTVTSPMAPSSFSLGINQYVSQNVFYLMVFASIYSVGLWMVWLLFGRVQSKDAMASRMLPLIAVCASSVCLAIVFVQFSGENKMCCKLPMSSSNEVCNYATVTENDPTSSPETLATYKEQSTGRPDVHDLLTSLKTSRNPAVFVSGPKQLMDQVRHSAKSCNCSCEVYEELFEL